MAVRKFEILESGDSVSKKGTAYAKIFVETMENKDIADIISILEEHGFTIEHTMQSSFMGWDKVSGKYGNIYTATVDVRKEGKGKDVYRELVGIAESL